MPATTAVAGCRAAGPRRCRTLPEACRALPLPRSRRANARARGQTGPRPLLARVLPGPPTPGDSLRLWVARHCRSGSASPATQGMGPGLGCLGGAQEGPSLGHGAPGAGWVQGAGRSHARCPVRLSQSWARPRLGRLQPRGAGSAESGAALPLGAIRFLLQSCCDAALPPTALLRMQPGGGPGGAGAP